MPGEIREEQLQPLQVTSDEIPELDASRTPIFGLGAESFQSISDRLLATPSSGLSQREALDAATEPSRDNPFVTRSDLERIFDLQEYSTWRLPVDSISELSDLPASDNRDGDCRLVVNDGIYQYEGSRDRWIPLLKTGSTFNQVEELVLSPTQESDISHDPDPNFSRRVTVSTLSSSSTLGSTEYDLWREIDGSQIPEISSSLDLSQALGPDRSDQVLASSNIDTQPEIIWSGGIVGLGLLPTASDFGAFPREVTSLSDRSVAWVDFATDIGDRTIDFDSTGAFDYDLVSGTVYNDLRLLDSSKRSFKDDFPSLARAVGEGTKTIYSKDGTLCYLVFIKSSDQKLYLIPYDVSAETYGSETALSADAVEWFDIEVDRSSGSGSTSLSFVYLKSTNKVFYNTFDSPGTLGTEEEVVDLGSESSFRIQIAQGKNDQPVVALRRAGYLRWHIRGGGGSWTAKGATNLGNDIVDLHLVGFDSDRFGMLLSDNGTLKYHEFTWDGSSYSDKYVNVSLEPEPVSLGVTVTGTYQFVLSFWDDELTPHMVFHYIADNKVYQGESEDPSVSTIWREEPVLSGCQAVLGFSSGDFKKFVLVSEDQVTSGLFLYQHNFYGYESDGTVSGTYGSFTLSGSKPLTNRSILSKSISAAVSSQLHFLGLLSGGQIIDLKTSDRYQYDYWREVSADVSSFSGEHPSPRESEMAYQNGSLWVHGGRGTSDRNHPAFTGTGSGETTLHSGLWKFDLSLSKWQRVDLSGEDLSGRYRHNLIGLGSYLYLFGGLSSASTDSLSESDIHKVNPVSGSVSVVGTLDESASNMSSAYLPSEDRIYGIGGRRLLSGSLVASGKVLEISVSPTSATTKVLTASSSTLPDRYDMSITTGSLTVSGTYNAIFLYGGTDGSTLSDKLYLVTFNTVAGTYDLREISVTSGSSIACKGALLHYTEDATSGKQYLIAIGGQANTDDEEAIYTNSVRLLELDLSSPSAPTGSWSDITPDSGEDPGDLAYSAMSSPDKDSVYLFGGRSSLPRGFLGSVFKYGVPDLSSGSFPSDSGSVTKREFLTWTQVLDTSDIYEIKNLSVAQDGYTQPTDTEIRVAVGFGDRESGLVYSGGSWTAIDSSQIFDQGMSLSDLENIPPSAWNGGQAFRTGEDLALYLLVGMRTQTSMSTPTLSKIDAEYYTSPIYKLVGPETAQVSMTEPEVTTVKNLTSSEKQFRISIWGRRG